MIRKLLLFCSIGTISLFQPSFAQLTQSYGLSQPYSPYNNYGTLGNSAYTGYGNGYTTFGVSPNSSMTNSSWNSNNSGVTTPTYMAIQSVRQPNATANTNQNNTNNNQQDKKDDKKNKDNKKSNDQNNSNNNTKIAYRIGSTVKGRAYVLNAISLVIDNQTVILSGLSAPGINAKCKEKYGLEWNCGIEAQNTLQNLVNGRQISCTLISEDKYPQAICYLDNSDLSKLMISSGFGIPTSIDGKNLMDEAKKDHRGIWNTQ